MSQNPNRFNINSYVYVTDSSDSDESLINYLTNETNDDDTGSSQRVPRSRNYVHREREVAAERLWKDYFSETPKYNPITFKRRYRMRSQLFLKIMQGISEYSSDSIPEHFNFFAERQDATGRQSLTTLQKCTAAIRQLAYGTAADMFDEYLQMSETSSMKCLDYFCMCVIDLYRTEYLRSPNASDVARLFRAHKQLHGFKGMLGSIDCMHWEWKNCPNAWKGQYTRGDQKKPTIMLEAVASYDLWIWHAFFGMAGSNNDINVLNQSPLFDTLKRGTAPPTGFNVNGHHYTKGYYLSDGIYPDWATLVKGWSCPTDDRRAKFTRFQASARKDIERAFGVLQGRFHILKTPSRTMSVNKMRRVMYCCVILHNMIQEDNQFIIGEVEEEMIADTDNTPQRIRDRGRDYDSITAEMRDKEVHDQLREDLVEHIWQLPPNFRTMN